MPDTPASAASAADDAPRCDPPLGYRDLAWWPEYADGVEGQELVIGFGRMHGKATNTAVVETEEQAVTRGHRVILRGIMVDREYPPKTKPVDEILVRIGGTTMPAKVETLPCDAVFSTQSAVRKFVTLYYDTHRMLDPGDWTQLKAAIADPEVSAIGHVYPSHSAGLDRATQFAVLAPVPGRAAGMAWQTLDQYQPSRKR